MASSDLYFNILQSSFWGKEGGKKHLFPVLISYLQYVK